MTVRVPFAVHSDKQLILPLIRLLQTRRGRADDSRTVASAAPTIRGVPDALDLSAPETALEGKRKELADAFCAQIAMVIAMPCIDSPMGSTSRPLGSVSNQQSLASTENRKGLPHLELGIAVVPLNLENLDNVG